MPKLIDVTKKYGNKSVFDGFSLDIEDSGVTAIMGDSGVGKTTLLNIIAGLTDFEGEVQVQKPISYVFQEPRLLEWLTVEKNLIYVVDECAQNASATQQKMDELLKLAEIYDKKNTPVSKLSGGQRQRVSLVRAFLYPSNLVLMDEPFNSLDIGLKMRLINLLADLLKKIPKCVMFVSHDIDEAFAIADRIYILKNQNKVLKVEVERGEDSASYMDERFAHQKKAVFDMLTKQ